MTELTSNINKLIIEENIPEIDKLLSELLQNSTSLTDTIVLINQLLESENVKVVTQILKNLADASKEETLRRHLTQKDTILNILKVLSRKTESLENDYRSSLPVVIQSVRCIANILFSNESARSILYDYDCGLTLIALFDHLNTEIIECKFI